MAGWRDLLKDHATRPICHHNIHHSNLNPSWHFISQYQYRIDTSPTPISISELFFFLPSCAAQPKLKAVRRLERRPSSIPLKWKGLLYFSALPLEHGAKERAFAKALRLELIHRPTADESFLLELLTYSTYCDDFMTTIDGFKGTGF